MVILVGQLKKIDFYFKTRLGWVLKSYMGSYLEKILGFHPKLILGIFWKVVVGEMIEGDFADPHRRQRKFNGEFLCVYLPHLQLKKQLKEVYLNSKSMIWYECKCGPLHLYS